MKKLKAFSLVELVIAIGLFTISISAFAFLAIDAYKSVQSAKSRNYSSEISKDILNSIMVIKRRSWGDIVDFTQTGNLHITNTEGNLVITSGDFDTTDYLYFFTIEPIYRDIDGNIVDELSGTLDPGSRKINLTIQFKGALIKENVYTDSFIVNNWDNFVLAHEDQEDFTGTDEGVIVQDGNVLLQKELKPDWCKPELTLSKFNLNGQSVGPGLTASPGNAYVSAGKNASGDTFSHIRISSAKPPAITFAGSFNDSKGNDIFTDGNYVYVATDSKRDTVAIVQNYVKVGRYGTNSSSKSEAVYVNGNYGFVSYGRNVDIFDLSSKTGARSKISTANLTNYSVIKDISVSGSYLYLGTSDTSKEIYIFNISNIASPTFVKTININMASLNSIYTDTSKNALFVGGTASSSQKELFVIDITDPINATVTAEVETNGMTINDIVTYENKLMLGGSGTTNYMVLKIDSLSQPALCGQVTISGSILAFDVVENNSRKYAYILTNDTNNELQVIEGGAGGGDEFGLGYLENGVYTSQIIDLEADNFRLFMLNLVGTVPEGTTLKTELKLSNNADMSGSVWFGPDIDDTFFNGVGSFEINHPDIRGRYFQYKITMESNIVSTPTIDKIEIYYGK